MIRGFVGANGSGKTFSMVATMALPSWRMGRPVVSNMRLYPEALGFPVGLYQPLRRWADIPRLGRYCDAAGRPRLASDGSLWSITNNEPCTLLLDEITSVLPSRDAVNVPPELQRMLNQLRKPDVWLGWTAPAWQRADIMLREVTMAVSLSRPVMPRLLSKKVPGQVWASHRVFRVDTYDGFAWEEYSSGRVGQVPRLWATWLWRPHHLAAVRSAYNTLEGVELLDHIQCEECGGKFTRKLCRCDSKAAKKSADVPPVQLVPTSEPYRRFVL